MHAISSLGKYTSLMMPWLMVKVTCDEVLRALPIPDLELDVHFGFMPGAPGADELCGINFIHFKL